jgi:hypothetical protein
MKNRLFEPILETLSFGSMIVFFMFWLGVVQVGAPI